MMPNPAILFLPLLALAIKAEGAGPDFNEAIRPLLNQHCAGCHGGVKKASDLSFLSRDQALAPAKSGLRAIVPGKPEESELLKRVRETDPDEIMPPAEHGAPLTQDEIVLLQDWIANGAEWKNYWAFEKPAPTPVPTRVFSGASTPVDHFIGARLAQEGLTPSKPADLESRVRRLSFDLTGLPPSPENLDALLADTHPNALERATDRLFASPHYGERWASMWMDLARYADSEGLGVDGRRDTWKYRDWLVDAYNANQPFDDFLTDQLAGDLRDGPTTEQLIATAFHRQTQANNEGGTDDEEFRVAAVIDRVNTTWEVFQGITFGCAQCHSHPYDPVRNEDYYKFMGFFNNSVDADLSEHLPQLRAPVDPSDYAEEARLRLEKQTALDKLHLQTVQAWEATSWKAPVQVDGESSTDTGVRVNETPEKVSFHAVGNVAQNTAYTFEFHAPHSMKALTALRIDILPEDAATAAHTPEWGAVLSSIQLDYAAPGSDRFESVKLAQVLSNDSRSPYDPNESLKRGGRGFGPYSKIFKREWCVVVPEEPLDLPEGSLLLLRLGHDVFALGAFPLVTRHGEIWLSDDKRWSRFQTDPELTSLRKQASAAEDALTKMRTVGVPIMAERDASLRRETRIFERGNWLEKGTLIDVPDVPASFPSLPKDRSPDRMALAQWLVSPDNPLTARVVVNRFWEQLFGTGLVETLEDFGASGMKPSHPELLDYLAYRFQRGQHWDRKLLLRELVLSSTYQQDASVSPTLLERDRGNRLLARGPRNRLTAEMVRDHALAAAGLLTEELHGPPVHPPLPEGIWTPFARDPWDTDKDEARYRRNLYVYWKRSIPFPTAVAFDAPSRELCNKRRLLSNTPIQALTTLNDPAFVECAEALARRLAQLDGTLAERLSFGYRLCVSHMPNKAQIDELLSLHARVLPRFQGLTKAEQEHQALAVVASVLLNLDDAFIK